MFCMKRVLCINVSRPEAKLYEYITYWLISSRNANCFKLTATLTYVSLYPLFSSYHQRWFVIVVSVLSNNILTAQRHRGGVDKRQKDVSWKEMVEVITALCLVIGQCWLQLQNINTNRNSRFWTVEALCSQKIMITRIETKTQNTKRQKDNAWKKKWSAACLAS